MSATERPAFDANGTTYSALHFTEKLTLGQRMINSCRASSVAATLDFGRLHFEAVGL